MNEYVARLLDRTASRARALLGTNSASASSAESTEGESGPPCEQDAARLATRIQLNTALDADTARAMASEIVGQAQAAMAKIENSEGGVTFSDSEALALESVIHVRSRPALRVHEHALESLKNYPGSELWQDFIADYEDGIMNAAAATGAVVVSLFGSGSPPWVQGSAWLIAPNRVLTNRHVLLSKELKLIQPDAQGAGFQLAPNTTIAIEFAADDREDVKSVRRKVTGVLFAAQPEDPVDIAVLAIDPADTLKPLRFIAEVAPASRNLFVVGHPSPMTQAPAAVQAVFGTLDGHKRVSFGKLLDPPPGAGNILHDASTVGGYSGAPVVVIGSGKVAGLHYYGDPASGNLAVAAGAIRSHAANQYCQPA